MTFTYATTDQFFDEQPPPSELGVSAPTKQKILEYGQRVVGKFKQRFGFEFAPLLDTKYQNVVDALVGDLIKGMSLYLQYPLLSITSVTLGDGTSLVENTDYRLYPRGQSPAIALRLINTSLSWTSRTDNTSEIEIVGIWGWHSDYDNAWVSSGDEVKDDPNISATATEITVADVTAADGWGLTPRFSPGQFIRIEDEYLSIVSVDIGNKKLTVVRGIRGSTAASHVLDTPIDTFKPDNAIVRAAQKQAAFDLARAGQFKRVTFAGLRIEQLPDISPEVEQILGTIEFNRRISV